jgi:hypothetical protein
MNRLKSVALFRRFFLFSSRQSRSFSPASRPVSSAVVAFSCFTNGNTGLATTTEANARGAQKVSHSVVVAMANK